MNPLDRAIALWSFGWLPSDGLPKVAIEALEQGLETPSMIELAAADGNADPHLHCLFEKALKDLGRSRLKKAEAGRLIAQEIAQQITQGKVTPLNGAKAIWKVTGECEELCQELGIFGGRVTEYEGMPDGRECIADLILAEAKALLMQSKSC